MGTYYDRYKNFRGNGEVGLVPFAKIDELSSDLYIVYDKSHMRLDLLSYRYYNDPDYGWLILQANPSVGSMEYSIPDGIVIRIPYPLETALQRYENSLAQYSKING